MPAADASERERLQPIAMYRDSEIVEDIRQDMIAWRRDIHANPETAFEEHRIVSRRTRATQSAVISVTQVHGGDTWNVIPGQIRRHSPSRLKGLPRWPPPPT